MWVRDKSIGRRRDASGVQDSVLADFCIHVELLPGQSRLASASEQKVLAKISRSWLRTYILTRTTTSDTESHIALRLPCSLASLQLRLDIWFPVMWVNLPGKPRSCSCSPVNVGSFGIARPSVFLVVANRAVLLWLRTSNEVNLLHHHRQYPELHSQNESSHLTL